MSAVGCAGALEANLVTGTSFTAASCWYFPTRTVKLFKGVYATTKDEFSIFKHLTHF